MSVAGLKKQFYKASQMVSEKVGGAEGTKLDEEFKQLERRADVTSQALMEVITKTSEYLQPNAASRAMSKMRGQAYSQPEALLGECMVKYGMEMNDSSFGAALTEVGESMRTLSEVKDSLDVDVKQNFIDPLQAVVDKDVKDIQHHLKKLEGHRLDYDYKKKRPGKVPDEEIRQALDKFHRSKEMAESSMHNLLETDVEQVSQMAALVDSLLQYHKQATEILQSLSDSMKHRVSEAQSRPRREFTPKSRPAEDYGGVENSNGGFSQSAASPPAYYPAEPSCRALYDFEPENDGELGFSEGDVISLVGQVDDNWLEGSLHGRVGYFPRSYVDVIVPLPN